MKERNLAGIFGIGLLIGSALGLAIGMLYAPRSGRETRAWLKEKAEDAKERAENIIDDAKDQAQKIMETAKSKMVHVQRGE
jgi:gas vesicle protein